MAMPDACDSGEQIGTEGRLRGYQWLSVDDLIPGEFQPREHFDDKELRQLGQTFLESDVGIVHPLVVRPRGGRYEIAAGERRWRAAKMVMITEVPCLIRPLTDLQCMTIGLVENAERRDLTPIEKAKTYVRAREEFELTQEALGQMLAISREVIANHERLLRLPASVQAYLVDGRLSERHGRALIGLTERDALMLAERAVQEEIPAAAMERLVRQFKPVKPKKIDKEWKDPDIKRFVERLTEISGFRVELQSKSPSAEKGFLKVRYDSMDGLMELNRRLARGRA